MFEFIQNALFLFLIFFTHIHLLTACYFSKTAITIFDSILFPTPCPSILLSIFDNLGLILLMLSGTQAGY